MTLTVSAAASSLAAAALIFAATTPGSDAARGLLGEASLRVPPPFQSSSQPVTAFVTASAGSFMLEDKPFRVIGANNYWRVAFHFLSE